MRMSLLILALGAFFFLSRRRRIRGSATTGPVNRPMRRRRGLKRLPVHHADRATPLRARGRGGTRRSLAEEGPRCLSPVA